MDMEQFMEHVTECYNNGYIGDLIVRVRRKYKHETEWRDDNQLLLWDVELNNYCWVNDWFEGEECVDIVEYSDVKDIHIGYPMNYATLDRCYSPEGFYVCPLCGRCFNYGHEMKECIDQHIKILRNIGYRFIKGDNRE